MGFQVALSTGRMKTLPPLWPVPQSLQRRSVEMPCPARARLFSLLTSDRGLLYFSDPLRLYPRARPRSAAGCSSRELDEIRGDTTVSPQPCRVSPCWVGAMRATDGLRPVRLITESVSTGFPTTKAFRSAGAAPRGVAWSLRAAPRSRHPCQSRVSDVVGFDHPSSLVDLTVRISGAAGCQN